MSVLSIISLPASAFAFIASKVSSSAGTSLAARQVSRILAFALTAVFGESIRARGRLTTAPFAVAFAAVVTNLASFTQPAPGRRLSGSRAISTVPL